MYIKSMSKFRLFRGPRISNQTVRQTILYDEILMSAKMCAMCMCAIMTCVQSCYVYNAYVRNNFMCAIGRSYYMCAIAHVGNRSCRQNVVCKRSSWQSGL